MTNIIGNIVSVIDTSTNTITATVNNIGSFPYGVAITPDGKKLYVANEGISSVSVIDTATNTVTDRVTVGFFPYGVAVTPDGKKVYVATGGSDTVSVIDVATNNVIATVNVGSYPWGVAVNPQGTKVYVTNQGGSGNTVSVIDTATNTVTTTVTVGDGLCGVAVSPDGKQIYVVSDLNNSVSIIDAATNKVTATVTVGKHPKAFGQFIGSPPKSTPTITWSTPEDITAGTALSSTQLNAVATADGNRVAGTYLYTPSLGTTLIAGQQQILSVVFAPEDATKYTTATKTVTINVLDPPSDPPLTSVPEFPSVVLPVAAILGIVVIFGRKKK